VCVAFTEPRRWGFGLITLFLGSACGGEPTSQSARAALRAQVEALDLEPIGVLAPQSPAKIALGRALFFDPILSGNRDQSCASCHQPEQGSSNGRVLAVGTGFKLKNGIRVPGPDHTFTPRNVPSLFDAAHPDIPSMFWDARLELKSDGSMILYDWSYTQSMTPRRVLSPQLDNLLAAQSMLPVLDRDEMRGALAERDFRGEVNELAAIGDQDFEAVWSALMQRLLSFEAYARLFSEAYPQLEGDELEFVHAANAISAFISALFQSRSTPWDRFLLGEELALSDQQVDGARLFYGRAQCSSCHSGMLLSDHKLYNIGVRPIHEGPSIRNHVDLGAAHRSHVDVVDAFLFRTPRLRNVAVSGPWMHNGAYTSLEAVVRHKLDAVSGLRNYDYTQIEPEFQRLVHHGSDVIAQVESTLDASLLAPNNLSESEISSLVAFLHALTSDQESMVAGGIPIQVPSGLPLMH
jgi:cytochrome c peroxidase